MNCANCGQEVPESAKSCGHCGEDPRGQAPQSDTKPQKAVKAQRPTKSPPPQSSEHVSSRRLPRWLLVVAGLLALAALFVLGVLPRMNVPQTSDVNTSIQGTIDALDTESAELAAPTATSQPTATSTVQEQPTTPTSQPATEEPAATPTEEPVDEGPQQIAFASDRGGSSQIWIINQDGSGLEQLTNQPGGACQPSWAPDGLAFAFTSPCAANRLSYPGAAIHIFDMDSGQTVQLTEGGDGDYDPAWAPEASLIAFTTLRLGRSQIFYYDLVGAQSINQSSPALYEYQPAWSFDSSQMALVTTAVGDELIFIFDLIDGQRQQLLNTDQSEEKLVSSPRWAPDGQGIYYTRTPRSGGFAELFYLPVFGNPAPHQALFNEAIPARDVSISPDGAWIAFESWPNTSNHDIWLATSAGQNRMRLTTDSANDFDAAWRP